MKIPLKTAVMCLTVLAPTSFGAFAPQQRPQKPEPLPKPAPTQDEKPGEKQRDEAKEQQRIQRARQAEHEKQQERVRLAREAEKEAEQAQKRAESPSADRPGRNEARDETRETARKMFEVEALHRDHVSRMDRLLAVYRDSNDMAKVEEVERLKAKEHKRYLLIIDQFRGRLGESYSQYESHLLAGQQRRVTPIPVPEKPAGEAPAPRREGQSPEKQPKQGGGQ